MINQATLYLVGIVAVFAGSIFGLFYFDTAWKWLFLIPIIVVILKVVLFILALSMARYG